MDRGSGHYTGDRDQNHPKEKKGKNAEWLSEGPYSWPYRQLRREEKQKSKEKSKDLTA